MAAPGKSQHAIHHLEGIATKEALIYLPRLVGIINTGHTLVVGRLVPKYYSPFTEVKLQVKHNVLYIFMLN